MNYNHLIKCVQKFTNKFLSRYVITVVLLCFFGIAAAQNIEVKGTVVSETTGEALIGVNVLIEGTNSGVITDIDGNFTIDAEQGQSLRFSYIGYETQVVNITEGPMIIRLREEATSLDEIVVVGYGVQKKKLSTGATLQVKGDEMTKMNTTSPLQALQGKTPGVNISSTSGQPGSSMKVTIRGLGTIGNSGPLYIIDGIEGDISLLNASDIQSIDILKDAASAAIYGAQAANGVILVTTKQGSKNKGVVSFDAYYGWQNAERITQMLDAGEYMVIMDEQALNSGSGAYNWPSMEDLANTNWLKQMFKSNAVTQNYALNLSGGSEASIYSVSLNYTSQEGIVGGSEVSNYERYGFRVNAEHNLYKNILKFGEHINFNYLLNTGVNVGNQYNNTLRGAFTTSPLSPVYSDNNIYDSPFNDTSNSPWYNGDGNPYGSMMTNTNNKSGSQRLLGDIYAELNPIKNLKIKSVFGINYYNSDYRSYEPIYQFSIYSYNEQHTTTNQNMSKGHTLTWTNTAGYDITVGNNHAISALAGMEVIRYQGSYLSASNWNLLSQFNDFAHAYLDNTTGQAYTDDNGNVVETRSVGGRPEIQQKRVSYFARLGYNFSEKYMLNATIRADGSSRFAGGSRWGYFPSISAGWVITNEDFLADRISWLNFLKLRVSWGQVGNQDIDAFQYATPINTSTGYSGSNPAAFYDFGTAGTNVPGAYPNRLSNLAVKWETSEQTNVGFDAYLIKSHLTVNADYYIKKTKDWLVQAPILATAGAGAPYINGGDVTNRGIELAMNWNDNLGDFHYFVGVNGAYNKNEVGNIPTEDGIIHGSINMLYDNSEEFYRAQNGHAIGYFWGYKTAGIFQSEQDIADWINAGNGILQANVKPGDVKYVDMNHVDEGGEIVKGADGIINAADKVDLGNGVPDFTYGFNFGFDYKNFDFAVNAYGAMGNVIVQSYRNHANKQANYTTAILDRWTGEGTSNKTPRVTESNINWQFSDLYLQDGDFLRFSNITVGYDLSKLAKINSFSQCRVYASVQNAFTFTKYNGMDPEIGYGTDRWVSGIDLGYYPRPRTVLVGVNLKF